MKPSYGLTDNEIETMLRDSLTHAEDDVAARTLREQQVEADRVLEALAAALAQDYELVSKEEREVIDQAASNLQAARDGNDHKLIKLAIEKLEQATSDFVARRMDGNIKKALSGHKIEEFDGSEET